MQKFTKTCHKPDASLQGYYSTKKENAKTFSSFWLFIQIKKTMEIIGDG
jgi:hypothetical protein